MLTLSCAERIAWARQAAAVLYARGATRVWAFGSLGCGRVQDERSDVDLAVEGLSASLVHELADELGRQVPCRFDLVAMETTEPALRAACLAGRELLPRHVDGTPPSNGSLASPASQERAPSIYAQRLRAVAGVLRECRARRVLDLGCGRGWLVEFLAREGVVDHIVGVDKHDEELTAARDRIDRLLTPAQRRQVTLALGLATCPDPMFLGYDAAVAMELVEHLGPSQLAAFESTLFDFARPRTIVITTPNAEFNPVFGLRPGELRLADHRFEWTRGEFKAWGERLARRYGYAFRSVAVGPSDDEHGSITQMGILVLRGRIRSSRRRRTKDRCPRVSSQTDGERI